MTFLQDPLDRLGAALYRGKLEHWREIVETIFRG
jgi:hypothetical protein